MDATERSGSGSRPDMSTSMPKAQDSATFMKEDEYASLANSPHLCRSAEHSITQADLLVALAWRASSLHIAIGRIHKRICNRKKWHSQWQYHDFMTGHRTGNSITEVLCLRNVCENNHCCRMLKQRTLNASHVGVPHTRSCMPAMRT